MNADPEVVVNISIIYFIRPKKFNSKNSACKGKIAPSTEYYTKVLFGLAQKMVMVIEMIAGAICYGRIINNDCLVADRSRAWDPITHEW